VRVPAPKSLRAELAGSEVTLGVRPEHLAVRDAGVPAEVIVVEPTGANTEIYCKVAGREVTAVVRERHSFLPGETIRLAPELTFLFDPATGARIQ
jgi:multiple sugar transport system ATP-binding protein